MGDRGSGGRSTSPMLPKSVYEDDPLPSSFVYANPMAPERMETLHLFDEDNMPDENESFVDNDVSIPGASREMNNDLKITDFDDDEERFGGRSQPASFSLKANDFASKLAAATKLDHVSAFPEVADAYDRYLTSPGDVALSMAQPNEFDNLAEDLTKQTILGQDEIPDDRVDQVSAFAAPEEVDERVVAMMEKLKESKDKIHDLRRENLELAVNNEAMREEIEGLMQNEKEENEGAREGGKTYLIGGKRSTDWNTFAMMEEDDGEAAVFDETQVHRQDFAQRMQQWIKAKYRWLVNNAPLEQDIRYVESRFGSGIGVYFRFFRWLFLNNMFITLIALYINLKHLIRAVDDGTFFTATTQTFVPSWFLLSSFVPDESLAYSMYFVMTIAFLCVSLIVKAIHEDSNKLADDILKKNEMPLKYSRLVLNAWDHNVVDTDAVDDLKHAVAEEVRVLFNEDEYVPPDANIQLYIRRTFGFIGNLSLITLGGVALYLIEIYDAFFSGMEAILQLTKFEKWPPARTIAMSLWRLYLAKMVSVVFLFIQHYERAQNVTIIPKNTIEGDVSDVFGDTKDCPFDDFAREMFLFLALEFIVARLVLASKVIFFLKVLPLISKKRGGKPRWGIATAVIRLLYSQMLFWAGLPYSPDLCYAALLITYISFKFEKWITVNYISNKNPWSARDTGAFFLYLYEVTFSLSMVTYYYFVVNEWDTVAGDEDCVPFDVGETIVEVIRNRAEQIFIVSSLYDLLIENSYIAWFLFAIFYYRKHVYKAVTIAMSSHYKREVENLRTQVTSLEYTVARKERIIKVHQRQLKKRKIEDNGFDEGM